MSQIKTYIRSMAGVKWFAGCCVACAVLAQGFRRVQLPTGSDKAGVTSDPYSVMLYKMLPLRKISRLWGRVNDIDLHPSIRLPVLRRYCSAFGCNLDEAVSNDLSTYNNLGALFRRQLKSGARQIDSASCVAITSPCDGQIVDFGNLDNLDSVLTPIKGLMFSAKTLLGPYVAEMATDSSSRLQRKFHYCVIYLGPGDYHGIHSFADDWSISRRSHLPGLLLSVNPSILARVRGVLAINERVVYGGILNLNGSDCFASMVAVGATNVGSIDVPFDCGLSTNHNDHDVKSRAQISYDTDNFSKSVVFNKGDYFGHFRLGSSVVIIFETDVSFGEVTFCIDRHQPVRMGQALFMMKN